MTTINLNSTSIIGTREIYEGSRYPISRDMLFRWIRDGRFPAPINTGNQFIWARSDVDAFFASLKESEQ